MSSIPQKPILIKLFINLTPSTDSFDNSQSHEENITNVQITKNDDYIQRYPHVSTAKCYWCHHTFTDIPIYTPVKYDSDTDIFHVQDNFCCFSHAASYITATYRSDFNTKLTLLYFLQYKMLNEIKPIPIVPPVQLLVKDWGNGDMTMDEYKKLGYTNNVIVYYPPIIPIQNIIQ